MTRLERSLIDKSLEMFTLPNLRFKHFSFICRRNKIISFGWNSNRGVKNGKKLGYYDGERHSELHCLMNFPYEREELKKYKLYNIRINNTMKIAMSRPCSVCQDVLQLFNVGECYYTNENGTFEKFVSGENIYGATA